MSLVSHDLYRFDCFELDASARVLKRDNALVPLKPKDVDVLGYLVLNAGQVVTKEELFQAVWPDAFIEENNLNQHISALRKALGDKSSCIVTIPGRGYQFNAAVQVVHPVDTLPESQPGDVFVQRVRQRSHFVIENAPAAALPGVSVARRGAIRRWAVISAFAGALTAFVIVFGVKHFAHPPQLCDAVLAGFTNTTGDAAFDQTLNQALEMDLAQSPFLNLLPRSSVRETLAQMQRKPGETLSADLAREVCERNNAQAVLHGAIASFGSKYLVMLAADSCVNGKQVAGAKAEAGSKEEILRALDEVAGRVRKQLGESAASIERFQIPIAQVTTSSLEALRDYSLARDRSATGDWKSCEELLTKAIALDPNFASAYNALAITYYNEYKLKQAAEFHQKAFDLRGRTSERERLLIEINYHTAGDYDLEEAVRSLQIFNRIYPNDAVSWGRLCNLYTQLGEYDQAIAAGEQGYRIDPHSSYVAIVMARAYKRANRFSDAKRVANAAIAEGKDGMGIHNILFQIAYAEHDEARIKSEGEWELSHQQIDLTLEDLGCAAATSGKMREATDDFLRARNEALRNGDTDYADRELAYVIDYQIDMGDTTQAAATLKTMKGDGGNPVEKAYFQAATGNTATARRFLSDEESKASKNTEILYAQLPRLRAQLALADRKPLDSIRLLEPARPYQLQDFTIPYQRAQAETEAGLLDAAASDYRLILANQGVDPISPLYPLAQLGLARVLALKRDNSGSRGEYEKFFAAWKDADKDLLLLKQSRAEYARLK
jgi:DNA-binding winged helix-turn-helix (wHTH) protein/Flp pilus assembly protein TadD